jgi:serine/threonine-protein kinase
MSQEQLGKTLLERGFVTFEQLSEAIREQARRSAAGGQLPLEEILVELEFITRTQLDTLLSGGRKPRKRKQPIEGFELVKKLGEGAMGATYLARQTSMDRLVALKVLRKTYSRNRQFVDRFVREARLAGRLSHVNIVQAQDVGKSSGFHYLVMEYVEGRSAYDLMAERGKLQEEFALHIAMQVARALEFAHEAGVVHRDIKPDNILVTGENIAKLCDFGLARDTAKETRLTQTGMMMGTPHYASPEQARGHRDVDTRSDIYSLGATLYHMVTGETPFTGSSAAVVMTKHLTEQMPWPADVNPDLSDGCCQLIAKMMAKEPEDRYQTPVELLRDMEMVIDGKRPKSQMLDHELSTIGRSGTIIVKPKTDPARATVKLAPEQQPDYESGEFAAIEGVEWVDAKENIERPSEQITRPPLPGGAVGSAEDAAAEGEGFVPFAIRRRGAAAAERRPSPSPARRPTPLGRAAEEEPGEGGHPRPVSVRVGRSRRFGDTSQWPLRPVRKRKGLPVGVIVGTLILVLILAGAVLAYLLRGVTGADDLPPPAPVESGPVSK